VIIPIFNPNLFIYTISFLIFYFIVTLLFSFFKGDNFKEKFGIFWSFLLLHYGYGFGYFIGIIKFVVFRKKPNKKDEILTR
jgi:biotin transporter BioY